MPNVKITTSHPLRNFQVFSLTNDSSAPSGTESAQFGAKSAPSGTKSAPSGTKSAPSQGGDQKRFWFEKEFDIHPQQQGPSKIWPPCNCCDKQMALALLGNIYSIDSENDSW